MRKQKSPSQLGFSHYDIGRLQKALKTVTEGRTTLRLTAVLLCAEGMSIPAVAGHLGKSFQVVYLWVNAYLKTHRVEALFDASKSGRPLSAPCVTDARIAGALKKDPLGSHTTVWTVKALAQHLSLR